MNTAVQQMFYELNTKQEFLCMLVIVGKYLLSLYLACAAYCQFHCWIICYQ